MYSGSCSALTCAASGDDGCPGETTSTYMNFESTLDTEYYIFLGGFGGGGGEGGPAEAGAYRLTISDSTFAPTSSPTATPFSVGCLTATPMNIDDMASGSTVEALEFSNQACGGLAEVLPLTRGVWYQVTGTGFPTTVESCSEGTDFNTIVSGGIAQHGCVAFLLCLLHVCLCFG